MAKNFDRIFILWIDRVVWLILMVVVTNLAVEITGYAAGVRSSSSSAVAAAAIESNYTIENESYLSNSRLQPDLEYEVISIETLKTTTTTPNVILITTKSTTKKKTVTSQQTIFGLLPNSNDDDENENEGERSSFFQSIFNIPITTLQAVSSLLQMIATTVARSGKQIQSKLQEQMSAYALNPSITTTTTTKDVNYHPTYHKNISIESATSSTFSSSGGQL